MFPDVEAEEGGAAVGIGDEALHEGVVLVGGGDDGEVAVCFEDEPGPAGAEALGGGFGELLFEVGEGAKVFGEGGGEGGVGGVASDAWGLGWAHGVPEEEVVPVAAAMVADGGLEGFGEEGDAAEEIFEGFFG